MDFFSLAGKLIGQVAKKLVLFLSNIDILSILIRAVFGSQPLNPSTPDKLQQNGTASHNLIHGNQQSGQGFQQHGPSPFNFTNSEYSQPINTKNTPFGTVNSLDMENPAAQQSYKAYQQMISDNQRQASRPRYGNLSF